MTQTFTRAAAPNETTAACYRTIPVTNGRDARCDEEDFAFLSLFKWYLHSSLRGSYPATKLSGIEFYLHHLVVRNEKKCKVNHRDRDAFNNCRDNLRFVSNQQIEAAKPKGSKHIYTSRYKGVSLKKRDNTWKAQISVGGVRQRLGTFAVEAEAARAYDAAAYAAFGEFAYLNFSQGRTTGHPPLVNDEGAVSTHPQADGPQIIQVKNGPSALCDPKDFLLISSFTWRAERVGSLDCPVARVCGHAMHMHHLALRSTQRLRVIHEDGNAFNNCHENLLSPYTSRIWTGKSFLENPTSRYKGVSKEMGAKKWRSNIGVRGAIIRLGSFETEEDAARAYDKAAREAFGPFACLNFPEEHSRIRS
jgi:hypothetical protein